MKLKDSKIYYHIRHNLAADTYVDAKAIILEELNKKNIHAFLETLSHVEKDHIFRHLEKVLEITVSALKFLDDDINSLSQIVRRYADSEKPYTFLDLKNDFKFLAHINIIDGIGEQTGYSTKRALLADTARQVAVRAEQAYDTLSKYFCEMRDLNYNPSADYVTYDAKGQLSVVRTCSGFDKDEIMSRYSDLLQAYPTTISAMKRLFTTMKTGLSKGLKKYNLYSTRLCVAEQALNKSHIVLSSILSAKFNRFGIQSKLKWLKGSVEATQPAKVATTRIRRCAVLCHTT